MDECHLLGLISEVLQGIARVFAWSSLPERGRHNGFCRLMRFRSRGILQYRSLLIDFECFQCCLHYHDWRFLLP